MADEYERVLLVKPDVFVYKIPPRTSNRGYRASDWKLDEPDWTGRLRVIAKGQECIIKLEDKSSGELFAQCPVDKYPGVSVEAVSDSSRYFVIKIMSETGRSAFIGIGFADRGDSFDLNVALQDHFKIIEKEKEAQQTSEDAGPKLDLKFKEGETIKVNLNISKKTSTSRPKVKSTAGIGGILLPPPPSASSRPIESITTPSSNAKDDFASAFDTLSVGDESKTGNTGWAQFS